MSEQPVRQPDPITPPRILQAVADASLLSANDIMGYRRRDDIACARRLFVYMLWYHMGWGIRETARHIDRSPAGVYSAIQKVEFELKYDRRMRRLHSAALSNLGGAFGCSPTVH